MQKVDLYQPILAQSGSPPLAIRIAVPNHNSISEGVPVGNVRPETYVLLSALPVDLRRRVELAVQALIAGG